MITPQSLVLAHDAMCAMTDMGEGQSDIPTIDAVLQIVTVGAGLVLSEGDQIRLIHDAEQLQRAQKLRALEHLRARPSREVA